MTSSGEVRVWATFGGDHDAAVEKRQHHRLLGFEVVEALAEGAAGGDAVGEGRVEVQGGAAFRRAMALRVSSAGR
jgi:hypothetical protein